MSINKELVIGAVVCVASLHYWFTVGGSGSMHGVPFLYAFTYRVFPFADWIWTAIGIVYLVRGIRILKAEAEEGGDGV